VVLCCTNYCIKCPTEKSSSAALAVFTVACLCLLRVFQSCILVWALYKGCCQCERVPDVMHSSLFLPCWMWLIHSATRAGSVSVSVMGLNSSNHGTMANAVRPVLTFPGSRCARWRAVLQLVGWLNAILRRNVFFRISTKFQLNTLLIKDIQSCDDVCPDMWWRHHWFFY